MELDSLKEIWKEVGNQPVRLNNQRVAEMLNKSSHSPLAKMKRNLRWELVTVLILFVPVAAYYFTSFNGRFTIIAWLYIGLIGLFTVYFYYKNRLLNQMQCATCMVKYNLERQVQTLEKFIRLYLIAGTIILPLLIIGLWFILYHRLSGLRESFHFLPNAGTSFFKSGLAGLILLLLFTVVLYYVNKWYIHKLYGRHIAKLRAVLREMEEAF